VKEINPDFDALLVFLANWEAIEKSALGRILSAGQLADIQELERIYAAARPETAVLPTCSMPTALQEIQVRSGPTARREKRNDRV
jgi:hypothetical protein